MIYLYCTAIILYVSPATLHIRAKTEQTWEAIAPFINWLIRKEPIQERKDSNCGLQFNTEVEIAERIHMVVVYHRLPVTVDLDVKALQ